MRAQVSIELFFVFLIFAIVLLWTSNSAGLLKANPSPLVTQAAAVASQVALLADAACGLNQSISAELNCIVAQPPTGNPSPRPAPGDAMLTPYRVRLSGAEVAIDALFSINAPVSRPAALCDFAPANIDVSCPSKAICLKRSGNLVQATEGGCTP